MTQQVEQRLSAEPRQRTLSGVAFRPRSTKRLRFVKAYWVTFRIIFDYLRLSFLAKVLGKTHWEANIALVHARTAKRIEKTILELQGLFIKVGQLISIMTNFLPEELRKPLESLQDAVPPRPYEEIEGRIREELGKSPDELFKSFDREPIASASLGQVHRATLRDGTEVVVKVQHADIDEIAKMDLRTIWRIVQIVGLFVPVKGMDVVYRQVQEMILAELDFVREAAFMEKIGKNLAAEPNVTVPALHPGLSTERVMTTSYVDGCKVSDLVTLDRWKIDRAELSRRLIRAYCRMIFVDGLYHADPHPGNVLVTREGMIVLLDFGAVAELSSSMREGIPQVMEAVIRRDTTAIFRALRSMGFIARGAEAEAASERIIDYFHRRFQDEVKLESLNLKDIKIDPQKGLENILDLRRQDIGIRELTSAFQVPKDWVLLERTTLLLTGVCTHLDPELNPMVVIRPYLEEFVLGKDRDFTQLVLSAVKDTALTTLAIPDEVRRYLLKANRGELEQRVRGLTESAGLLYALGHQLIFTVCGVTCAYFGYHLFFAHERVWASFAGAGTGFFALCVMASMALAWYRRK